MLLMPTMPSRIAFISVKWNWDLSTSNLFCTISPEEVANLEVHRLSVSILDRIGAVQVLVTYHPIDEDSRSVEYTLIL